MTTVAHEIDGKVGVVTLAKPPHNLIDDKLIEDLVAAYHAVAGPRLPGNPVAQLDEAFLRRRGRWRPGERERRSIPIKASSRRCCEPSKTFPCLPSRP